MRRFIDREKGLRILREFWRSPEHFLIVYGRRRVGKSRLIKEFLKEIDPSYHVYLLAGKKPIRYNLRKFIRKLSKRLGFRLPFFDSFVELFEYLARILRDRKFLIVIDEFTYLVERDEGVLSDFQEIVDEILPNTNIKLILTGSLVGMMETKVLGYKSPLYGRSQRIIKLPPLGFRAIIEWFGEIGYSDAFKIYAVTNGVPKYLEFFEGKNIETEIKKVFFNNSSFLFRDAIELLKEELRDPTNYIMILEAIANGLTKLSEISNYTFIESTKLTPYLRTLRHLGIVQRQVPILSPKKARRGIYVISDFYYLFWFRFVSPYFEEIEAEIPESAINDFEKNFNTYLGLPFECLTRKLIRYTLTKYGLKPTRIGKWWHGDIDIDIVAIDDKNKKILFGETKWSKLESRDIYRLPTKLEDKSRAFPHKKNYQKMYCIVAREFKEKPSDLEDTILIDLNELCGNICPSSQ